MTVSTLLFQYLLNVMYLGLAKRIHHKELMSRDAMWLSSTVWPPEAYRECWVTSQCERGITSVSV